MELFGLRQISVTVQCHSCLKHVPEGSKFCGCGVCLRPDADAINRIRARFQSLIVPYYFARVNRSRGKKHGDQQRQEDHWKAVDGKKGPRKHNNHPSILSRWQNDEQYRTSQLAIGWTENYCHHLDYLTTIDIFHCAPYQLRSCCESTVTMKSNDPNPQSGPMWKREDSNYKNVAEPP